MKKKSKSTPFIVFAVFLAITLLSNLPKSDPIYGRWYGMLGLILAWVGYAVYAIRFFNKK